MELSVAIDQGNSSAKISVFSGDEKVGSKRFENLTLQELDEFLSNYSDVTCAVYSSVVGDDQSIIAHLKNRFGKCYVLNHLMPMPLEIGYATPATLGHDRIAAAVGAVHLCGEQNLLVVDLGTAITYDFVEGGKKYVGGNIAPGLKLRFKGLADYCVALPKVNFEGDVPMLGYDTPTAIRSGVVMGVVSEVAQMAVQLEKCYGKVKVVLTGGDCNLISDKLQDFDVEIYDDLVTIGLNRILQYNEQL